MSKIFLEEKIFKKQSSSDVFDLLDFNNKVNIKADFTKSKISVKDLKKFYNELNGNDIFNFTGKIYGKLNNFKAKSLNLYSKRGLKISGDLSFLNAVNRKGGFVFEFV